MDNDALLKEYVERQSEPAFTSLVEGHISLVYSTALRVVQDPALARDVTQSVFILLARKAATIRSGGALPGWLYRVTRYQSMNTVRRERIRRQYEAKAMELHEPQNEPESSNAWEAIGPQLDEAMNTLSAADQNAIVLRFFQGLNWREVGTALALNDNSAQKRVGRALDKLRKALQHRGVAVSAGVVGLAIAANTAQAAPMGLATTIASASLAKAASAGTLSTLLTNIEILFMKKTTYVALSAVILSAITVSIISAGAGEAGLPVTAANLRQGLVLHFPFDRQEAEVTDRSGAGHYGQVVGAQWVRDAERGGVYRFTPPNQYIQVPNDESLCPTQITLSAWIQTTNRGDTWRRVMDKSWTNGFALSVGGGHTPGNRYVGRAVIEIAMKMNRSKGFASSDAVVTDGRWHHLVTTYDGAKQILYVDGVAQKAVGRWSGIVPKNAWDLTIGMNRVDASAEYNEVGASFDGLIDEPMIYNRALSMAEVEFLYTSQRK